MNFNQINNLIKGKKVTCIFGFVCLPYFNKITTLLKKDVKLFINTIAEIV